ncbi:MAG TPA: ArsR family transcriptional regulator [Lamprocystis sp. (in: g-proteobacteria)]|nr:ArsR family transcriptional regulator [Lamprocystis sp. (in: g-proteobacteria)]
MKAWIGVETWTTMQERALAIARRVDAGQDVPESDNFLNFSSAEHLASELTPARLKLLDVLKPLGPVSVEGLAKHLGRSPTLVQTDIAKLLDLGLVEQDTAGRVFVPWEAIEIHAGLIRAAAA